MAASNHNIWVRLCRAIGRDDLVTDPRYADNVARVRRSDEINGIVADWIGQRTREEVVERFEQHEVAFSAIYDIQDIFDDPHYAARQALIRILDPDLREAVVQNIVPKFSETPGSVDYLGSAMGAHNDEIYRGELGYSDEKIAALMQAKVI
jgi:formyl-CoA transferase